MDNPEKTGNIGHTRRRKTKQKHKNVKTYNRTKNWGWPQVLANDKQFLLMLSTSSTIFQ
jgi:hypothetical protein